MYEFVDENGANVKLAFQHSAFSIKAKHVLILCQYRGKWLLTDHPDRGLEFPGGKVETKETLEQAAKREVWEETGAIIDNMYFLGEYQVEHRETAPFVKAIFYAEIKSLEQKEHYLETRGPLLVEGDILSQLQQQEYSFIMKDRVVPLALEQVARVWSK